MEPCINPDGANRFASWVNSHKSITPVSDPNSLELNEPWPGGRTNHYWFDLNRDWPGMSIELGGELFETERSMAALMRAFIIALIGVYFLLVLLFDSLTQPFLVMVARQPLMGLVVGMFLIYNAMSFSVVQRRPLWAALRALGVTRGEIRNQT